MVGISKEQKKILNALLDKYERSATFRGENTVKQSFSLKPEEVFSGYSDDADYDCFVSVNEAADSLSDAGFVKCVKRNTVVLKIMLNTERTGDVYKYLGRTPKSFTIEELINFLEEKSSETGNENYDFAKENDDVKDALRKYISLQIIRLKNGKLPEYYDSMPEYGDLWILLEFLSKDHEEIFVRDLSVKLYQDSKKLEKLSGKAESLLYKYGTFPEKDKILEECSVLHTPSYVMCKGCMKIQFIKQELDLGEFTGDIAFSNKTLREISGIEIYGKQLITIENLTTFHRYEAGDGEAVVYLGGFHNSIKREFIKMIYRDNPGLKFYHFGDIDAGGFYIYEHLCKKTGISFVPMNMGIFQLKKYYQYAKKLTPNDVVRIENLIQKYTEEIENENSQEILKTLQYMLSNNIKLEQEAMD